MKSAFLGVRKIAGTIFSTKLLVDFGKSGIEAEAEINASNSQLEQIFRTLIYAFAKTAGMESSQALEMMEDALQVIADSAVYYDCSLEETSESLKSFLKGNFENDVALGLAARKL